MSEQSRHCLRLVSRTCTPNYVLSACVRGGDSGNKGHGYEGCDSHLDLHAGKVAHAYAAGDLAQEKAAADGAGEPPSLLDIGGEQGAYHGWPDDGIWGLSVGV